MALLLGGCAAPLQSTQLLSAPPAALAQAVELNQVPFFPQQRYQCGPAALATVLSWSGAAVSPDALVPEIYLPARRGSLQIELTQNPQDPQMWHQMQCESRRVRNLIANDLFTSPELKREFGT